MKTDELIRMLSTGVEPVQRHLAEKLFSKALLAGIAISMLLLLAFYGLRPDLKAISTTFPFWMKFGVPLANVGLGLMFVRALATPGKRPGIGYWILSVPVLVLWTWALWTWVNADASQHADMLWGKTWKVCIKNITLLALPTAVGLLAALRQLAPTRPALSGAIAGWLAGGVGAAVYALHCPELAAPFLAVWYVLGMLVPTALFAWIGNHTLRW
jgi:hypothetical protein